jgi:hypothetical protein
MEWWAAQRRSAVSELNDWVMQIGMDKAEAARASE